MRIWSKRRKIAHPGWMPDACVAMSRTLALYYHDKIPDSIAVPMLVVPMKRMLRGIYGSNWAAAWELLRQALASSIDDFWNQRVAPFWHLTILRKTRKEWAAEEGVDLDELDDLDEKESA